MKKRTASSAKFNRSPRNHPVTILLNDKELKALNKYCEKYHIRNRSQFIRETIMKTIVHRFDKDSPTLFD